MIKKILIIFIIWFTILFTTNKLSVFFLDNRTSYETYHKNISLPQKLRPILLPWLNFDGRNYLEIANNWYQPYPFDKNLSNKQHFRVFFPLYPGLIKALSLNFFINPIIVGLLISYISILASLFLIYKILKLEKQNDSYILKVILLLLFFPTSFYFLAFYTESIFLLLSLLVFYFLNKKNYLLSSVFCAIATGSRIVGITLIIPIVYEIYLEYKKTKKINFSFLLAPTGLFLYMIFNQVSSGNAFSFYLKLESWNKKISILGPFQGIFLNIQNIINDLIRLKINDSHLIKCTELITIFFYIYLCFYLYKKIKISYWIFIISNILIILFSGSLTSIHRYVLILFPIYFFVAKKIHGKKFLQLIIGSIILLLIFASLFLRGYWVA